jgi:MOSC domain-containing protein YiiM
MIKRFEQSTRSGFYLSVSKEGAIAAGDSIQRISNDNAATVIEAL